MGQADPVLKALHLLYTLDPHLTPPQTYFHFTREQTETQRSYAVCPELHLGKAHLGFEPSLPDPEATFVTKGPCGVFFIALKD